MKKVICKKCGMTTSNRYVVDIVERKAKLTPDNPAKHVENNCNGIMEIMKGNK